MFYIYKAAKIIYNFLSEKACHRIARLVGGVAYFVSVNKRKNLEKELSSIGTLNTHPETLRRLTRRIYRNFNICLADFLRADRLDTENISSVIKFDGIYNLDDALAKGSGVIIVSAHIGNWEMGGIGLARLGYPVHSVYLPHKDERLDRLFKAQRVFHGEGLLALGSDTRRMISVLSGNQILVVLSDIDTGASDAGVEVAFLGKKVLFPRGAAALAVKMKAPIVPGFCIMKEPGIYNVILEEPIFSPDTQDKENDIKYCVEQFADKMEEYVKRYPEQWFSFGNMHL
ncbi:MAG: lysophospholipid acyltransferase family protein [bacterium]